MFYYFRLCIFAVVEMDNRNLYTNKQNIMEAKYITLTKENIEKEHICCAFSDKKCKDSYELKKTWLKNEFENGYVFRRLDERAKVFIVISMFLRIVMMFAEFNLIDFLFL